jgi:hypothetical protein
MRMCSSQCWFTTMRSGTARVAPATRVQPVEVFFNLVYVLAVTQLTHHLLDRLSPHGAVEAALPVCYCAHTPALGTDGSCRRLNPSLYERKATGRHGHLVPLL